MDDTNGSGMLTSIHSWFARPFNSEGSAVDWFLFVGLLIAISVLWGFILREIKEVA